MRYAIVFTESLSYSYTLLQRAWRTCRWTWVHMLTTAAMDELGHRVENYDAVRRRVSTMNDAVERCIDYCELVRADGIELGRHLRH